MDSAIKILINSFFLTIIISLLGCLSNKEIILGIKMKKSKGEILNLDDNLWETSYQYHDLHGNFQFGQIVTGKRNDRVFVKGFKVVENDFILIKEKYFYNIAKYDSIEKILVKTPDNKIMVKEIKEYKDGKVIKEKVF